MSEKPMAAPETVEANAARSGYALDEAAAKRIANAISPALKTFDCADLALPMAEEPSGWDRLARPEIRS